MAWPILVKQSGDWTATCFSDGSVLVEHATRLLSDVLYWHQSVTESRLPQRAKALVVEFRNAHRDHFRLGLAWRAGSYGVWKRAKQRVSYSRYNSCEAAGEWYVPWSKEGRKVLENV